MPSCWEHVGGLGLAHEHLQTCVKGFVGTYLVLLFVRSSLP